MCEHDPSDPALSTDGAAARWTTEGEAMADEIIKRLAKLPASTPRPQLTAIGRELSEAVGGDLVAFWNWRGGRLAFYAGGGNRNLERAIEYAWDGIGDWMA